MSFKIKNWKLAILALIFFSFFVSLGCWQLSRGKQKELLIKSFAARTQKAPINTFQLADATQDFRFFRASFSGYFDNDKTLILDNKTLHGKIGYEIYTPFHAVGLKAPILVDRGFVPIASKRNLLPKVKRIDKKVTITGLLNTPPAYYALGAINASADKRWPLLVEYINTSELADFLGYSLFPLVLILEAKDPAAYAIEWQVVIMKPEKHYGYAVQWFAIALTLLILFVVLNFKR